VSQLDLCLSGIIEGEVKMEKKPGYKRLLYSYLPILVITGTIVIAFAITITYEFLIKETDKSNQIFTSNVVDNMQNSSKNMELMLVYEMVHNSAIHDFLYSNTNESNLINYKASTEISRISKSNPLIYSIYLYRAQDQTVLTRGYVEKLDNFPDKKFVQDMEKNPQSLRWSPIRSYTEFPMLDPPERVISISKNSMGNQGIVVLNVKVDLLLSMVSELKDNNKTFMNIIDIQGTPVSSTNSDLLQAKVITRIDSDYLGWSFISGVTNSYLISQAFLLSWTQIIAGIISVLIIIAFIVYITRKNYGPIEKIMRRISAENHSVKCKQFFMELQEDEKTITLQEWQTYASHFELLDKGRHLFIVVMEIDKYVPFLQHDRQELLSSKKRLTDAVHKWTDPKGRAVCADWISGDRMAILIHVLPEQQRDSEANHEILDKLRVWVEKELCFSVTIGIGCMAVEILDIKTSFREALAALQYKMTTGSNRVIIFKHIQDKENKVNSLYFKWLEDLIHHFRMTTPEWEIAFARIFDHLEEIVLKKEVMQQLLNHWIHRFTRDMEEISPEINEYWNNVTLSRLTNALKESESMKEIRNLYLLLFKQLYEQYVMILESKNQSKLVYEVKKYIEDNYANPDLSLNHISDRFGINGKYASQLFKEEFGIKFVDFLIGLRMEHAKKMLLETEKSINEISLNVGYVHTISFGRIFKKVLGVSPGDYRKQMIMH
jgi:two-component system response regulator YesN